MIDYKVSSIKRTDDATFVTMRVYEGDEVTAVDPVTGKAGIAYQRASVVEEHHLRFRGNVSDDDILKVCCDRLRDLAIKTGKAPHPAQLVAAPAVVLPVAARVEAKS